MEKTQFNGSAVPQPVPPFQAAVNGLGEALMRQVQARGGQVDLIWMQINLLILAERVAILESLIKHGTKMTPAEIELALIERLKVVAGELDRVSRGILVARAASEKAANH